MENEKDPLIGQALGSYRVDNLIGIGGMGRVYRGVHQTLGRVVAIKLLPQSLAEDSAYIQRFVREAQIAAQLNHPNLIACYDFGDSPWGYYFVMEFVEGISLADHLIAHHKMKLAELAPIIRQVCAGLGYAHSAGIIHRDIKPDNILVTRDGSVKLADLGLAKLEDKSDSGLTQVGMAVGTPNYISPEQVRGDEDIDWRTDIYSLGATLFHCITGRIPYDGNTPSMIMTRHVNDPVPIARQANPDVNEAFSNLLVRMMQKNPLMRVANCEEVISEIDKIVPPPGVAEPAATADAPVAAAPVTIVEHSDRAGLFWLFFGAFVLAAALVGGGFLFWKKHQEREKASAVVPASPGIDPKPAGSPAAPKPESKPPPEPPKQPPVAPAPPEPVAAPEPPPAPVKPPVPVRPVVVGVRNPDLVRSADFVATEAEPVQLSTRDPMTLTAQQNIFLKPEYAVIAGEIAKQSHQSIEIQNVKFRLTVLKCVSLESALTVRVHRLTADPAQSFQYDHAPLCEIALKPSERPYEVRFDVTEDFKRAQKEGAYHGLALFTSQGGEAAFASGSSPDQKIWPALEIRYVPLAPK